jgi:hypothetical protein
VTLKYKSAASAEERLTCYVHTLLPSLQLIDIFDLEWHAEEKEPQVSQAMKMGIARLPDPGHLWVFQ